MTAGPGAASLGVVERFVSLVESSLGDGSFVRFVLSNPDPSIHPVLRLEARLIELRGQPAVSVSMREPRREVTRNLGLTEAPAWLRSELPGRFRAALLETTRKDWQVSATPGRPMRLVAHPPRSSIVPERTHDLPTTSPFESSARDWLAGLGLTDATGRIQPRRADKHRQVLRYAEILGHLIRDAGFPGGAPLRVVDMGCGRGYLTFAAWQLLRRQSGFECDVVGVDVRPELVKEAQALVERLQLQGLRFQTGSIGDADLPEVDVLVALHACNTATDDALRRGVQSGARLILAAPCCHQELRPLLGSPEPLAPLLSHGILAERMAEWLTDGLRALGLEAAGYRAKLIEFVASEHTPKNLLLAGVRTGDSADPERRRNARSQFIALKAYFGIGSLALDTILPP